MPRLLVHRWRYQRKAWLGNRQQELLSYFALKKAMTIWQMVSPREESPRWFTVQGENSPLAKPYNRRVYRSTLSQLSLAGLPAKAGEKSKKRVQEPFYWCRRTHRETRTKKFWRELAKLAFR